SARSQLRMDAIAPWRYCRRVFSSTAILSLVLLACVGDSIPFGPSSAQPRKRIVIFAVSSEGGEGSMDAVAFVEGKKLLSPYDAEQKDRQKAFGNEYFKQGTVNRLIFGGGDAGTATVTKWSEGCNSIHASVTVSTSA